MATEQTTPRQKPAAIGIWAYCEDERQKARYEIAAKRGRYGSTSAFMQAGADQLTKQVEKKHGPITDEDIDTYLAEKPVRRGRKG